MIKCVTSPSSLPSPPPPPLFPQKMFDFPVTRARGWTDENCEKTLLQTLVPDPKEERVVIISVAFRNVYPVVITAQGGQLHEDVTDFGSRPQRGTGND